MHGAYNRRYCGHCGELFSPKFPSQKLCFPKCVNKRDMALASYDGLQAEIKRLEQRNQRQTDLLRNYDRRVTELTEGQSTTGNAPDDKTLRWMMQQVHPDKHSGSDAANAAAQWLNQIRRK